MSLDGFVSSSAIFHDKDGTTTMKAASLASTEHVTSGKIAVITGTCSSSETTIDFGDTGYTMADGTDASWVANGLDITRIVFSADPAAQLTGNSFLKGFKIASSNGNVAVTDIPEGIVFTSGTSEYTAAVKCDSGTASYTILAIGD